MVTDYSIIEPRDIDAEKAILGKILEDSSILPEIASILKPDHFYSEKNKIIFKAIIESNEMTDNIDEIVVSDVLKSYGEFNSVGGFYYLGELIDCTPVSGNPVYWAEIIKNHSIMRKIIELSRKTIARAADLKASPEKLISYINDNLLEIRPDSRKLQHIKDVLKDVVYNLEHKETGIKTGYIELDMLISGIIPSDLVVIAGRPGMGKTAFALGLSKNICKSSEYKSRGLFYSREMPNYQLGNRLVSAEAKINTRSIKSGTLEEDDWKSLSTALNNLGKCDLVFDDSTKHVNQIVFETKSQYRKKKLDFVVIDYLQRVNCDKRQSREQEVSYMSNAFKDLAKDLNIPIFLLAQLNRDLEKRDDKVPKLSDLRESGSIEQDADLIMFLYREDYYVKDTDRKGIADLVIAKHRNGPTGAIELQWEAQYARFTNYITRF